ncbi:MAG: hypothetical protein NZO16_04855 [Deltaproteobacteria bacterium]|nr:hypothetical protein [Deltaproteobacteria bacterium]
MRGIVALETALVAALSIIIFVFGYAFIVWLHFLKEISAVEQSFSNLIRFSNQEILELNWESIVSHSNNVNEYMSNVINRFELFFSDWGLRENMHLFFEARLYELTYNTETGAMLDLRFVSGPAINYGSGRIMFEQKSLRFFDNFSRDVANRKPPRISLLSIPIHYDFGPSIFGNVRNINFYPFRRFLVYFFGARPRNNFFDVIENTLRIWGNFSVNYSVGREVSIL